MHVLPQVPEVHIANEGGMAKKTMWDGMVSQRTANATPLEDHRVYVCDKFWLNVSHQSTPSPWRKLSSVKLRYQYDKFQFIMLTSIFTVQTACISQNKIQPSCYASKWYKLPFVWFKLVQIQSYCVIIIAALAILPSMHMWPLNLFSRVLKDTTGHRVVQAVWSHVSRRGIRGGNSVTGTVFSLSTSVFTCQYHSIMFCTRASTPTPMSNLCN
jgi:hypothetical protein